MVKKITTVLLCTILAVISIFVFLPKAEGASANEAAVDATEAVAAEGKKTLDPYDGGLHSIYELNCEEDAIDSHAGVTGVSTLETDYRNSYFIKNEEFIDSGCLWYPRTKRLSDGSYIMFFQDGRWGPNVYYTRSADGYEWDEPAVLFATHLTYGNQYARHYATCDAIELENGNIVVAAIFHATKKENGSSPSRWLMSEKGIVTRLSRDGGDTWTDQQVIYNGRCWEPSFLQLPDGTVQMYFTQSAPKDAIYNSQMGSHVSSGVGLITSKDNGETWTPIVTSYPYVTSRIVQQYIYTNENGVKIMTDQMPVAILLHDKKTIVMALESLRGYNQGHATSIARSHDFFATKLEENETGPYDRNNMVVSGAAPYIVQFPSGEVALSNFSSQKQKIYIGNETATEFNFDRSFVPFPTQKVAMWGDMFVADSHVLIASAGDTIVESGVKNNLGSNGIGVSRLILNHRIDAKKASMKVDADTSDWYDNSDALFVGSINQAQTSIRVAHDDKNVYLLFEHLDYYVTSKDEIIFYIRSEISNKKICVTAKADGIVKIECIEGSKTTTVTGWSGKTKIYGTKDVNTDKDEGIVFEISIPKTYFSGASELRLHMKMYGNDGGDTFAWDGFNGISEGKITTWQIARLSNEAAMTEPPVIPDPPATSSPSTSAPSTSAPSTSAPSTSAPSTSAPVTTAPSTSAEATSTQTTSSPSTSAPDGTSEQSRTDETNESPADKGTSPDHSEGTQALTESSASSEQSPDLALTLTIIISASAVALALVYMIIEFRKLKK